MIPLPSFQQLRFLCALAERRHFGKAAACCAVTQSTLSGGIKELEARLGVVLFERTARFVLVTPIGEHVVAKAKQLLAAAEDLVGMARNAQEPLSGPLRLGVIPTIGPYVLPSLLEHAAFLLPNFELFLREDQTETLLDKLADGSLDALLLATPYDLSQFEVMELAEDPIVVAMAADHPLRKRNEIDLEDLQHEQLLMLEEGHCLRSHSLQACRVVDPVRNEVFQATTLRTLVQMVAANLGITLLPQIAVAVETAAARNVVVRPIAPNHPCRTLVLAWRQTSSRGDEFRTLGNLIQHCLSGRQSQEVPFHGDLRHHNSAPDAQLPLTEVA
jgi:LysR family hydrogen peroxide-inducible transcriptional activator